MTYYKNLKLWLYGLFSSVISGAAGSAALMLVDPKDFNFGDGLHKLETMFAAGGVIALINYLMKHPLPELEPDVLGVGAAVSPPPK